MNQKIEELGLLPVDRIVVPKSGLNVVQHHAIYLGQSHQGVDLIAENKIGYGVRIITAEEFFRDVTQITRIKRFNGNNYQRKLAIQKALSKAGKPYDLINYNCEHFADDIQHGIPKSSQVANAFVGLIAILVIGIFFNPD